MSKDWLAPWAPRGPYGTNENDCWLAPGSDVQKLMDERGRGEVLVHEMLVKDGELQECLYVTAEPEMIERATRGHEQWVAEQAARQ